MKHKVDCFLPFDPTPSSRKWPRVWACYIPQWLLMVAKQPQTPRERNRMGQDLKRYLTRSVHTVPGDIFADRFLLNLTGDVGR